MPLEFLLGLPKQASRTWAVLGSTSVLRSKGRLQPHAAAHVHALACLANAVYRILVEHLSPTDLPLRDCAATELSPWLSPNTTT